MNATLEKRKATLRRPFHNALEYIGYFGAGEGIRTLDPNLGKVGLDPSRRCRTALEPEPFSPAHARHPSGRSFGAFALCAAQTIAVGMPTSASLQTHTKCSAARAPRDRRSADRRVAPSRKAGIMFQPVGGRRAEAGFRRGDGGAVGLGGRT